VDRGATSSPVFPPTPAAQTTARCVAGDGYVSERRRRIDVGRAMRASASAKDGGVNGWGSI